MYRIKKGFYGNNLHEAKEIILFIENELDDDDFSDGGRGRKAFPDPEKIDQTVEGIIGEAAR